MDWVDPSGNISDFYMGVGFGQGTSNPRYIVIFSVTEDKCQDTTSN